MNALTCRCVRDGLPEQGIDAAHHESHAMRVRAKGATLAEFERGEESTCRCAAGDACRIDP